MKRDMDLARKILEQIEDKSEGVGGVEIDLPEYTSENISYQIMLLHQAGLLKAHDCTSSGGFHWMASSLTWQGHEFLDAIRNDTVWNNVKEAVKEKGGSIPFEVLKALAMKIAGTVFGV